METKSQLSFALASLFLFGGPALGASVGGTATLVGEAPAESVIKMNADPKCLDLYSGPVSTSYYLVGNEGQLANVFVFIRETPGGNFEVPATPVVLSQKGCLYQPAVSGIQVDQMLHIENNDDNLHNVRALSRANRPFNLAQPSRGVREKTFKLPEEHLKFKCDIHPWMESYIFVLEHPFFDVTGADGSFDIVGVPAGDYTLVAWHVKLGEQTQQIQVGADGQASADFAFEVGE